MSLSRSPSPAASGPRAEHRPDGLILRRPPALARVASALKREAPPPVIFVYHGVGEPPVTGDPHGLMLRPERLGEQVDALLSWDYDLMRADRLWGELRDDPARRSLAALTFDDALAGTLGAVLGVLADRGAHTAASVFVPSGLMGKPHPDLGEEHRIADAAEIRELAAEGVQIGSHTVDHTDLTRLDPAAVLDQLRRSRATLEDLVSAPVTMVAYPYGRYSPSVMAAAQEAGYDAALASDGGGDWRTFALPREAVFPGTGRHRLALKARGLDGPAAAAAGTLARIRRAVRRA
ncbi:MAG TPA: polysaccharide deacetylase family protein [Solirubrobacteraceae bacterium]|nr:polysaccharide deacetylase family protein [Solirubrobacteraceae bacterium]